MLRGQVGFAQGCTQPLLSLSPFLGGRSIIWAPARWQEGRQDSALGALI